MHPFLLEELDLHQFDTMTDVCWAEIGKAFLHRCPEKGLELVKPALLHFGTKGTIFGGFNEEVLSVLKEGTKLYPEEVWEQISKLLENQTHFPRIVFLERWLKGEDSSDFSPKEKDKGGTNTLSARKNLGMG